MQYLRHSTTEVTMTALSDVLVAARSLEILKNKAEIFDIMWDTQGQVVSSAHT